MAEPVLIYAVDDEPQMRVLLDAILSDHYAVETFDSSEACLARLAIARPGMLLIDVGLPGIDGYALCRRIKDDAETAHIPVSFISGHDTIDA
ncbi:partial Response regulator PleD, partial [Rhodocyclaceae bacterium]